MNVDKTISFFKKILFSSLMICVFQVSSIDAVSGVGNIEFGFIKTASVGFSDFLREFRETVGLPEFKSQASLSQNDNRLRLVGYGFSDTVSQSEFAATQVSALQSDVPAEVIGETLVYPNPFRMSGEGGVIYYNLSKAMDIEIQIYDMMANMVVKKQFNATARYAEESHNKLPINAQVFGNVSLPAGAYFYLLINNGNVLAKGKMAIIP